MNKMDKNIKFFFLLIIICGALFAVFLYIIFRPLNPPLTTFPTDSSSNVGIYRDEDGNEAFYDKRYITEEDVKNLEEQEGND